MPPKVSKDTTHGWLVVATCSAAFFLFIGNASCLGLVEVELSSLFKDSGSSLSAINALYNGLGWGLGIFVSITPPVLIDLFGVDKLSSTLGTNYLVIGTGYLLGGPLMRALFFNTFYIINC